ncbi:MAG: FIST N-terminal domain-containing protein [Anaerolineae bacterium]
MLFASATTQELEPDAALADLTAQVRRQLGDRAIDLALVFISPHFGRRVSTVRDHLRTRLSPRVLLGVTCEAVIGRESEIENLSAMTLLAGYLPGVELAPFAIGQFEWKNTLSGAEELHARVGAPADPRLILLLADPFSSPIEQVLDAFNECYPAVPLVGGMASGATRPGVNALILNDQVLGRGAAGVVLSGAFEADVLVSQGCRPVGRPYRVTEAERNILLSLEDAPALEQLQNMADDISEKDRDLLESNGIYVGRAIDSKKQVLGRGDFVVRGILGVDPRSGAMSVGDEIREGELIQFHVRDQETATEDLEMVLMPQIFDAPPQGALLFSCNGRGTHLYDHPNGDIAVIQKVLGNVPAAGFFCTGEIGPIGGRNLLHGHTACAALFRPRG